MVKKNKQQHAAGTAKLPSGPDASKASRTTDHNKRTIADVAKPAKTQLKNTQRSDKQRIHQLILSLAELSYKNHLLLQSLRGQTAETAAPRNNDSDQSQQHTQVVGANHDGRTETTAAAATAATHAAELLDFDSEQEGMDTDPAQLETGAGAFDDLLPELLGDPDVVQPALAPAPSGPITPLTPMAVTAVCPQVPAEMAEPLAVLIQAICDRDSLSVRQDKALDGYVRAILTSIGMADKLVAPPEQPLADGDLAVGMRVDDLYNAIQHMQAGVDRGTVAADALIPLVDKQLEMLDGHAGEQATTATTLGKLVQRPESFNGAHDSKPIRAWLKAMTNFFNTVNCNPQQRVQTAVTYLRGKAESYWFAASSGLQAEGKDITAWDTNASSQALPIASSQVLVPTTLRLLHAVKLLHSHKQAQLSHMCANCNPCLLTYQPTPCLKQIKYLLS